MSREGKTEALIQAADLPLGESVYSDCPSCGGKLKFSVTRNREGVLWNCFRAACPEKGFEVTLGQLTPPARKQSKLRPWNRPLHTLTEQKRAFLLGRFDILARWAERIRQTDFEDYALPINDPRGYERGYVIRQPWGDEIANFPKALTRMHAEGPTMSWYKPTGFEVNRDHCHKIVLVEDQMSAMVVASAGIKCAALLGTQLDNEKVREIAMERPEEVIIALDADATDQAFGLARKWGLAFRKTRVAVLEQDLKAERMGDIVEVLGL